MICCKYFTFFTFLLFYLFTFLCTFVSRMAIKYSKGEEIWNSSSHGAGILLGVAVGIVFLIWCFRAGDSWASTAVILYLVGMLFSYITSTVYHALPHRFMTGKRAIAKETWRKLDHAAIYWHIAGSYSPLTLVALLQQNVQCSLFNVQYTINWGWSLFSFVWLCAIAGTIVSFVRLKEHSNLETFCFIGMGLSVLVAFKPLINSVSTAAFVWIIAEGVCYITGAVFYTFHKKRYMHSIFHFFVLAGSICHIIAVWDVLIEYL